MNNNETNRTRFFYRMKEYGFSKLIMSADFLIAATIFVIMIIDKKYQFGIFLAQDGGYVVAIFAAASTLFSITLATLAIILSFSGSELMQFLRQKDRLNNLLFPFWLGNATYLIVLILSLLYLAVDITKIDLLYKYLYPAISALFVYALISTFYLLGTVIRFGFFMDMFDRTKQGQ